MFAFLESLIFQTCFFWLEHLQRKPDLYGVVNQQFNGGTVDGRNPAPVDMENVHNFFIGFTLQGTNISPTKALLKMIFLFHRWDMLIPWRVISLIDNR